MFQEVFHQTMSFKFFSHIDFIVKKFLFQFQKSPGRGTHSLAMSSNKLIGFLLKLNFHLVEEVRVLH
jgi:hypothetical protein